MVHKPNLNPLKCLHVYVLLNRNTDNVVYLLKKFQVFSYLGSKCQKWCANKRGQVPLLFLTLPFFVNVPQQTEYLEEPFLALRIYLLKKQCLCCSDRISQRMLDELKRDLETLNIVVRK